MSDFVHLHLHSEYSLLDGACRISEIPAAAKRAGHTACAITDHGAMYGAVAFYRACKKEGIKPIIGCEVYVAPGDRHVREHSAFANSYHLVLLCKNEIGYRNLIYLVSEAFVSGFYSKPRIDMELLKSHHEGLIALSACLAGYIPRHIMSGEYDKAEKYALEMKELFGEDFYLEVQDHGLPDQKTVNSAIFSMAEKLSIETVATNDVHYLRRADCEAQAILLCIQTGSCIKDGRPIGFETDEFYYKETWEMERLFPDHPEAIANTAKVAEKCNFDFEFGHTYLPGYTCPNGEDPGQYLKTLATEGLSRREAAGEVSYELHPKEEYLSRVEYELGVIDKMGYSRYYLIVWDFVNYSKSVGIPVGPGRGSGAGSLVAYLVGITDIDPMRFDLLFERFLNPERVSMPDFDIDFCYNRRDEAIQYVRDKYGADHTSQIITFGTMAARAAVRDVGRALGLSYGEVDAVARLIPQDLNMTLDEAMKSKELREMYDASPDVRRLIDTARRLEGMPRHASTHAAGVVITEKPVTDYVPVALNNGVTVTQYDMTTVADLGLLKFDFLALRYLTVIDNAEKQIKQRLPDFSIAHIPLDDKKTYALISKGNTDGVFQLESPGMKQTLMQLRPEHIDDIIAAIALFRPGPMSSIPKYIEARHGGKREEYVTPLLAPILDSTYGCIVYQEQVMQIFRDVAGYSLGHADVVRRAISKKHADELLREREAFISGAAEHGVDASDAQKLFDDIADFADYAFNKSHAAAYALTSYRTAYLKAHFLLEYNCALITSVLGNPQKIYEYLSECRKHGIAVVPPDVNRSYTEFRADGGEILFGLGALKNLGTSFTDMIVREREYGGKFADFDDFLSRMQTLGMNKRQFEALIKAGALDSFGIYRSRLLAVYEKLMERSGGASLDGQLDIFSTDTALSAPKTEFPELPEFSAAEKLRLEKEISGMFLSGHMLDDYSENCAAVSPDSVSEILSSFGENAGGGKYKEKDTVKVCGIISQRTNKMTKADKPMAFVSLEGAEGSAVEVIVFPDVLAEYGHLLTKDEAVCVVGKLSKRDEEDVKILMSSAVRLSHNGETPAVPEMQGGSREYNAARRTAGVSAAQGSAAGENRGMQSTPAQGANVRLYLKVPSMESDEFRRAQAFISIFRGNVPVTVYDAAAKTASHMMGAGARVDDFTIGELREILGDDAVVVKSAAKA